MQIFEWQQRQQQVPFWVHMIAGSCAGLSQHLSMLPLDNVKTHCQAGSNLKLRQIMTNIYRAGGISNFYSGSSVIAMGCVPAHACYFLIFQQSKKIFTDKHNQNASLLFGLVGAASSLFHDLVMTPTEVIKQRLQLIRSSQGTTHWVKNLQLITSMYKNQGLISFYRSFGINYLMNVPYASMLILINENLKILFGVKQDQKMWAHYLFGGIAGALASIPTTPFDVIKTKLNTQSCANSVCQKKNVCDIIKKVQIDYKSINGSISPKLTQPISTNKASYIKYHNILDTTMTIYKQEGAKGFFQGVKMRMTIASMSSAISWGVYHSLKNTIYNFNKAKPE